MREGENFIFFQVHIHFYQLLFNNLALPNKLNPKYKDSEKKKSQASLTPTGIYKINNMVCSVLGRKPTSFKIIKCYHQERSSQMPNKVVWDTKALPILQCHTNMKNLKSVALTVFVIF